MLKALINVNIASGAVGATLWITRLVFFLIIVAAFRPTTPEPPNREGEILVQPHSVPEILHLPTMLIDPPSRYLSSEDDQRAFLESLDALPDTWEVRQARQEAESNLAFILANKRTSGG